MTPFCPNCGHRRKPEDRACEQCGYVFDAADKAPAVPAKEPRGGLARLLIAAVVLVVGLAGAYVFLNSQAGIGPGPTQTTTNAGRIVFGADYNPATLDIIGEVTQFPLSTKVIAWSARFREPAGATTLTLVLASVTGSSELIVDSTDVAISNPAFDVVAHRADLVSVVDGKAGTYVLRYLRGATILAEGRFMLA